MVLPEKQVENQIKNYLDDIGAYWFKTLGGSVPAGTPDVIACVNGTFVAIEVKKPTGGKITALQKSKIKKINQAGGLAFVANDVSVVEFELRKAGVIE